MKYINYELKKLFGIRYIWVFLTALLVVNGGIAFYTAHSAQPQEITTGEISDFFDLYFDKKSIYGKRKFEQHRCRKANDA